jgi:murein DD-endopeptidase MepM/ murein hydrolase activator NlpD
MRALLAFVLGVIVGAAGLFAWLRQVPHEPAVAPAASVAAVSAAPPPAAPAPGAAPVAAPAADPLAAQLPPAPVVEPDLTEADLPLRPDPGAQAALAVPTALAPGDAGRKLLIPVEGVKAADLADTFGQPRGKERHHEALDIMAPKGTRVVAAADGKVVKLFKSKPGGLTVYQFDPSEKYAYYYAHLDKYAPGLKEGAQIKRGDLVGFVGSSGNADPAAPHLHFAVVELTPKKEWWKGTPVNPYPLLAD